MSQRQETAWVNGVPHVITYIGTCAICGREVYRSDDGAIRHDHGGYPGPVGYGHAPTFDT